MTPTPDPIVPIPPATTLSYAQSSLLMTNLDFRGRIKVACLSFADYILGEPITEPAHNSRLKWANETYQQPDAIAMKVQPPTVMQDAVQGAGDAITDAALQTAVETVVNTML